MEQVWEHATEHVRAGGGCLEMQCLSGASLQILAFLLTFWAMQKVRARPALGRSIIKKRLVVAFLRPFD